MSDVVDQAKEALYGGDAEEGRSHLYPLINEITRLEGELWLVRRARAALKAENEDLRSRVRTSSTYPGFDGKRPWVWVAGEDLTDG